MTPPKDPHRVEVGRANRMKRGPLSIACRERLSQAAKQNQPWLKSTGPKTEEGKAKVSRNLPHKNVKTNRRTTLDQQAQTVLTMLRNFEQLEVTATGAKIITGMSEDLFAVAENFLNQEAKKRSNQERAYLRSCGLSEEEIDRIVGPRDATRFQNSDD